MIFDINITQSNNLTLLPGQLKAYIFTNFVLEWKTVHFLT